MHPFPIKKYICKKELKGSQMKLLSLLFLLSHSFSIYASGVQSPDEVSVITYCVHQVGPEAAVACAGVKSSDHVSIVRYCVNQVGSENAVACKGVKTSDQVSIIRYCVNQVGTGNAAACGE